MLAVSTKGGATVGASVGRRSGAVAAWGKASAGGRVGAAGAGEGRLAAVGVCHVAVVGE
jgi:hypothetical protein